MAKLTILATLMVFAAIFSQAVTQPIVQYSGYDGYDGYNGYNPGSNYEMNEWQQRAGHGSTESNHTRSTENINSKSTIPRIPFFGDINIFTTGETTKESQTTHTVNYFKK
ncbi:uncharacterized protein LOC141527918 isoform X2 [Cotesia typhae]|uniref:uncharacterized protein LOC141527918 isoform X2 n=1 Tax=Cotesia typhae TaxID=2053667 RepID=UPI003D6944F0